MVLGCRSKRELCSTLIIVLIISCLPKIQNYKDNKYWLANIAFPPQAAALQLAAFELAVIFAEYKDYANLDLFFKILRKCWKI